MTEEEKKLRRREACRRWRAEHPGYSTAYYRSHRDRLNEQSRAAYRKNIERSRLLGRESKRIWRRNNIERSREISRKYRAKNREAENRRTNEWRNRNREYNRMLSRIWYHSNRSENLIKQRQRYRKNRSLHLAKKRAWYSDPKNKKAVSDRTKRRYTEKKEYLLEQTKKWRLQNRQKYMAILKRRRARKLGADVCDLTNDQWQEIKLQYGMRCVYCGKSFERLTQDHVIPLSKGGNHTKGNVVPACRPCNSRKRDGPPLPFVIYPLTNAEI